MGALFQPNIHSKWQVAWKEIPAALFEELSRIARIHYPFERVESIEQVDEWERMGNNFKIRGADSESGITALLRKHKRLRDPDTIAVIDKITAYLKKAGLRVPVVIPTKEGESMVREGGCAYQMYEFIEGQHFRGKREELREAARQIGLLHAAFAELPFKGEVEKNQRKRTEWSEEKWRELLEKSKADASKYGALLRGHEKLITDAIAFVKAQESTARSAKRQVVRNSLHPHDTLFDEDGRLTAILDFEETGVGELSRDVGGACHRFVRQFVVLQGERWEETLPEGVAIFLDSYQKKNPLERGELARMPLFIYDELLRKIYSDASKYYLKGVSAFVEGGELAKKLVLLSEAAPLKEAIEAYVKR